MKYDFTSILDRKGKDALAVDGIGESLADEVLRALGKKVE